MGVKASHIALIAIFVLVHNALAIVERPAATSVPGISTSEMPQFVLFTHDDNTDKVAYDIVTGITNKHVNKNGCQIKAAFYTTSTESNCGTVMKLYQEGHEIAEHTVTHPDLHKLSSAKKKEEILGARDWIIKCGVPASEVVGHRSPYLSDDVEVRSILNDNGYLYDTSIPEVYPSPTSPSAAKRLLPYSMWEGNKMVYSCKWFDNINHCTTTEKPNIYELPMWMYQKAPNTAATSDLMDPTTPFVTLKRELDRNLVGNRAPVGAWTHSSATDYLTKAANRNGIDQFLGYALTKPEVWVVTPRQLIDWMQNPVPLSQMPQFMANYTCTK